MKYLILVVAFAGLWGCVKKPSYPIVPEIEFVSLKRFSAGTGLDSLRLTIRFKDGDGDLGLGQDDTAFPFSFFMPDGKTPNPFYYNIFVNTYRLKGTQVDTIVYPDNSTFNGRFPKLNELGGQTPLRGELTYTINIFYDFGINPIFRRGDELFFDVRIADRRTHLSNLVQTSTVIIGR